MALPSHRCPDARRPTSSTTTEQAARRSIRRATRGATAVQSYRHSHYGKDRFGVTLDEEWLATMGPAGSALRAGIWYEDSRRDLGRDWHRMLDPMLSFKWDEQAYWHQYEWEFPQHVFKWYVEETLYVGPFALTGGVKQYRIGVSRNDQFLANPPLSVDSDSDLLFSGGVTYETPVEGLDLFAGYAENFRAIGSTLLEVPGRSLDLLEPETASNLDVGLQYGGDRVAFSVTRYSIDFTNRIFYLGPQTPRRSQLSHPRRRCLLQRGRDRNERCRVCCHRADAGSDIVLLGPHVQRLGIHRVR